MSDDKLERGVGEPIDDFDQFSRELKSLENWLNKMRADVDRLTVRMDEMERRLAELEKRP